MIRGIEYLAHTQRDDGSWAETEFTGTGFPRVFYLRYHYYPIYFPLLAVAGWNAAVGQPTSTDRAAGDTQSNGHGPLEMSRDS